VGRGRCPEQEGLRLIRLMGIRLAAVAVAAQLLVACGGSSNVISTPPSSNASKTTVTVFTTQMISSDDVIQIPLAGGTVVLSQSIIGTNPQNIVAQGITDQNGQVSFNQLPANGQLCVSVEHAATFVSKCRHPFPATVTLLVSASN
jgi:hypothetical protein